MDDEVPRLCQVLAREGFAGLLRCFPAQIRDRTTLTALEGVNADCHKFDVFVRWPDGTINRPQIVAFQDLYSGKMLSWRIDHSPNMVMVMAAFGELVETWGILAIACSTTDGSLPVNGSPAAFRTAFALRCAKTIPLVCFPIWAFKFTGPSPQVANLNRLNVGSGILQRTSL
ncbi:transposase domain-containing protein [Parasedimentitalea marina]|uniref:transposase domain-containing protein n=1 Tax=Parasedimentitalea marina TaxID=2483033 RepID=UPI003B848DF2